MGKKHCEVCGEKLGLRKRISNMCGKCYLDRSWYDDFKRESKNLSHSLKVKRLRDDINNIIKTKYRNMKRSAEKKKVQICTFDEFRDFSRDSEELEELIKNWIASDYDRDKTPSIGRIDLEGNYLLDNLHYVEFCKNSAIGKHEYYNGVRTNLTKFGKALSFSSKRKAAWFLDIKESELRYAIKKKKQIKGWKIIIDEKND